MSTLTEEQRRAVQCRTTSVVLASGAGCGKTHTLTQRFVSHLRDDGADVGQVVAITFTERAARQMRARIRQEVERHLQAAAEPAELTRWEQHLRGLETAQISTIHAFCAALLRQHAVAAQLDPRFEVLEDFLAVNLEQEALNACLQELLTAQTPAGDDLRALILHLGWRPTVAALRQLLQDWDPGPRRAWQQRTPADIAADWQDLARVQLLPRWLHYLSAAQPKIARCLWLLRQTPCRGPKMAARIALLLELMPRLGHAPNLADTVAQLCEAAKVKGTELVKAWDSEEDYKSIQGALEEFRAELPKRLELFLAEPTLLEEAIHVGQQFVHVATEVMRIYRLRKRRHGVLDFQDLLVLARDLLRDRADVRERLQKRYRFVLIDELQDTDPVQLELIEHLTGAALTLGKLFAVGDHSQSIYRFRGAEVKLFQALRRRMALAGQLSLTLNFRSQPAILDFANALFGPAPDMEPSAAALEDFAPLHAQRPQVNPGPCIEMLWSPHDGDTVQEGRKSEAVWLARRLAGMIAAQESLVATTAGEVRPVQPGDIVLLFRAMTNVALYETALREHGLDYYLVGGRAFFAQQEIYDLLNLLRTLENPEDALSLAGTLRSPFCCLSDEALYALTRQRGGLWAGLHSQEAWTALPASQLARVERASRLLTRWRALKNRQPITELLRLVFAESGYDAAVQFEFLGERKLANLWKLQDMARSFDRTGLFGLAEFCARLTDLVESQPREEQAATAPEHANVVRIMSIHQAKGLEFPVVVVPDLAAEGRSARSTVAQWDRTLGCVVQEPGDDPPAFAKYGWQLAQTQAAIEDWREDLRTLYVACTRAMDYLILSAALPPAFGPKTTWMLALAERFDLLTGACRVQGVERVAQVRVTDSRCPPPEVPARAARAVQLPPQPEMPAPLPEPPPGPEQWDAEDGSDQSEWLPQ